MNLIGEFTDYNDGFVLPFALPFAARACAARRDDDLVRVASAQRSESGEARSRGGGGGQPGAGDGQRVGRRTSSASSGRSNRPAPTAGADLLIDSNVPIGAGLSSSAALECSVALALHDLYELPLSRQELALVAQRAENEYIGVPTGIMDQTASLLCRSGHALFLDTRTFEARQVPLDLAPVGLTLLVVNTGVKHALGNSAYADRVRDCRRAAEQLHVPALRDIAPENMDTALAQITDDVVRRRARHVISEQGRVLKVVELLESGRPAEIGPVLSAGHRSLRDDYEVSCAELDVVVDTALASGALGARMTGGGFGGSAVVLVELAKAEAVTVAVGKAFAVRDFSPPQTMEIVPGNGASRIA